MVGESKGLPDLEIDLLSTWLAVFACRAASLISFSGMSLNWYIKYAFSSQLALNYKMSYDKT